MNEKIEFLVPQTKQEYGFVGLQLEPGRGRFIFPCQYLSHDAEGERERTEKIQARRLVRLIKQVQKEYLFGGDGTQAVRFSSMMWLIRDYIDNGYYTETESVVQKGSRGRIHWRRTIGNNSIYFDHGNIIYREMFVHKNMLDTGSTLMQIYKCCLDYSLQTIGFLYNVGKTEPSVFDMDSAADINFMLHVVRRELNATFHSYKKLLFHHLLTILSELQGAMRSVSLSMTDK